MQQSRLLMSAEIHFIEQELSIVHIPLQSYGHYLSTILQLLFPAAKDGEEEHEDRQWQFSHDFLNVSVTPLECSVVCERNLAAALFTTARDRANQLAGVSTQDYGSISIEPFIAMSVEGAGMEAGQRVLEVTSPLARAGISIFFITTYVSDYILVPVSAKSQVIRALKERGFTFEQGSKSYVNPSSHHRHVSSDSEPTSPIALSPTTMKSLQDRMSLQLSRHQIVPKFDRDIRLVQCASRTENPHTSVADDLALQHGLTRCLIRQPRFLSVTMTKHQSASLVLEKRLVANFNMTGDLDNVLLGAKEDIMIPIILDLAKLGMNASGIVCGVAGKLVEGPALEHPIDLSYLSTAETGVVIVAEEDLVHAMYALRLGSGGELQDWDTRLLVK